MKGFIKKAGLAGMALMAGAHGVMAEAVDPVATVTDGTTKLTTAAGVVVAAIATIIISFKVIKMLNKG